MTRVRRSAWDRARLIDEWRESGLSLPIFCGRRGINRTTMAGWIYKPAHQIDEKAMPAASGTALARASHHRRPRPSFVPIKVRPECNAPPEDGALFGWRSSWLRDGASGSVAGSTPRRCGGWSRRWSDGRAEPAGGPSHLLGRRTRRHAQRLRRPRAAGPRGDRARIRSRGISSSSEIVAAIASRSSTGIATAWRSGTRSKRQTAPILASLQEIAGTPIISLAGLLRLAEWARTKNQAVQGGDPCRGTAARLAPPRARRSSGRRRSTISGVC